MTDVAMQPDDTGAASQSGDAGVSPGTAGPDDAVDSGVAGGNTDQGTDSGDSVGGATGTPDAYSEFNVPEGMDIDSAMMDKASPIFQEIGLSQDQAQMVVDLYGEKMQEIAQEQANAYTQQLTAWEGDVKADKELGGDAFDANIGIALKGLEQFGTPELKDFLETSGAGSHPEVIRAFYRMGKLVSEDNPGGTHSPAQGKTDHASILYPDL